MACGTLLRRMEAFPRIKRREILDWAWLVHSLSSRLVCLAIAWAIFDTNLNCDGDEEDNDDLHEAGHEDDHHEGEDLRRLP